MWIASKPNAFVTTLLVGFIAGFFLGAHAVLNSNTAAFTMLGCVAIGVALGFAACRAGRPSPFSPPAPRNPKSSPPSDTIDDAQAALATLGYGAREARIAVASALASLGDDATVSTIVRAAFRKV